MTARRTTWVLASALVVASVGFGARALVRRRATETILPHFVEPAAGPRAPVAGAFGFKVGHSTLDEARAVLARRGLDCPDTSMRALMREMREARRRERDERKRRGEPVDAVSGASALDRPSPKERNPQVRLSCEPVAPGQLGEHDRPASEGRLLLVFDSPTLPLRHVSFERTHQDPHAAEGDLAASLAALRARFGPPSREPEGSPDLAWLRPVTYEWRFADLQVKVFALHYGARGVSIGETIEVPWPVRPDAPRLASLRGGAEAAP